MSIHGLFCHLNRDCSNVGACGGNFNFTLSNSHLCPVLSLLITIQDHIGHVLVQFTTLIQGLEDPKAYTAALVLFENSLSAPAGQRQDRPLCHDYMVFSINDSNYKLGKATDSFPQRQNKTTPHPPFSHLGSFRAAILMPFDFNFSCSS